MSRDIFLHRLGADPGGIEMVDCGTREALIEQQPHRAWGMGKTLSSTKAAAKASTCRISSSSSSGYSRFSSARSG